MGTKVDSSGVIKSVTTAQNDFESLFLPVPAKGMGGRTAPVKGIAIVWDATTKRQRASIMLMFGKIKAKIIDLEGDVQTDCSGDEYAAPKKKKRKKKSKRAIA